MFDFHMHSTVSFDGHDSAARMVEAAAQKGLKEICFTDHIDYDPLSQEQTMVLDTKAYHDAYDALVHPNVKIRRGVEFGMLPDNAAQFKEDLKRANFDFVIGSVHFAENVDIYFQPYWEGKTVFQAERRYLEETMILTFWGI